MAHDKASVGKQTELPSLGFPPFSGNPAALKSFVEAPFKFYSTLSNEVLGFAASSLQEQADYLKQLSQCHDLAETMSCHSDFVRKSWARSCDESLKIFNTARANLLPAASEQ